MSFLSRVFGPGRSASISWGGGPQEMDDFGQGKRDKNDILKIAMATKNKKQDRKIDKIKFSRHHIDPGSKAKNTIDEAFMGDAIGCLWI